MKTSCKLRFAESAPAVDAEQSQVLPDVPRTVTYLSHSRLKFAVGGNGRAVWGVAVLAKRIYVVTYCMPVVDVYDIASYEQLTPIVVDGLKVISGRQKM